MKTLIIYYSTIPLKKDRLTIKENIFGYKKNLPGRVYLVNYVKGQPKYLIKIKFDLIILHYSFLGLKFSHPQLLLDYGRKIKNLNGYKIAFPQDEYINSFYLNKFFNEAKVDQIFTLFISKKEIEKVYPINETGINKINTVIPGYVFEESLIQEEKILSHEEREIDIGYRARKNPFWLGEFSLRKWQIAEEFLKVKKDNLVFNISTKTEDTFTGKSWHKFIQNSKFFLGVEGGASYLDSDGKTRDKVNRYIEKNPDASYDVIHQLFLTDKNRHINYFTITPRVFEAISFKTCLILMEGYYNGILIPDKHYIPLKKDYSNIDEVFEKMLDKNYVEKIVETAYKEIILSNLYTYKSHVKELLSLINTDLLISKKRQFGISFYIFFVKLYTETYNYLYYVKLKIQKSL